MLLSINQPAPLSTLSTLFFIQQHMFSFSATSMSTLSMIQRPIMGRTLLRALPQATSIRRLATSADYRGSTPLSFPRPSVGAQ